jgi:anti-sigma-K factor RskA
MSMDPAEMDELLGAYALDAVSDDERRAIDEYLLANPRARAEVQEHREVATMLAWSGMDAPDGLWDRIAVSINGPTVEPGTELGQVLAMRPSSRRKSWTRTIGSWAVATAAAATIAIVAVKVSGNDATSIAIGQHERIVDNPRSVQAELTSSADGNLKVRAFIDPNGNGFLTAGSLPDLDPSRTYQLWGQFEGGSDLISLGVLGAAPTSPDFTVTGKVVLLAITEEVEGGVVSSANPVVVAGTPT